MEKGHHEEALAEAGKFCVGVCLQAIRCPAGRYCGICFVELTEDAVHERARRNHHRRDRNLSDIELVLYYVSDLVCPDVFRYAGKIVELNSSRANRSSGRLAIVS